MTRVRRIAAIICIGLTALTGGSAWATGSAVTLADAEKITLSRLKLGARAGVPRTQVMLALRYLNGAGVPRDERRAFSLLCQAADSGSPDAASEIGTLYARGGPVAANAGQSQTWRQVAQKLRDGTPTRIPACPDWTYGMRGDGERYDWPAPPPGWAVRLARQIGRSSDLDPDLLLAVMAVESRFGRSAVSHKGAQGLMQLMPATARRYAVRAPFDAEDNVRGAARYLNDLKAQFRGNLALMLAAYNAGEGAVERHGGIPPYRETRQYVEKIAQLYAPVGRYLNRR